MKRSGTIALLVFTMVVVAAAQRSDLHESFEAAWTGNAPAGWTKANVVGTANWNQKTTPLTGQIPPPANSAHHKLSVAWFPSNLTAGNTTRLESPLFNFTGQTRVRVRFFYVNTTGTDSLRVRVSTNSGTSWSTVQALGTTASNSWAQQYIVLDAVAGMNNVKIGLEAVADGGTSDIWVDRFIVQYPLLSIREIQEVPVDSLRRLDTLQRTEVTRWTMQRSFYYGDTVSTRGIVVVPAKVVNFTANGYNCLILDPNSTTTWGGLLVRPNLSTGSPDTALAIQWGITNPIIGDTIRCTGYVDEFPLGDPVSATQLVPLYSEPLEIAPSATGTIPPHVPKLTSDFYLGLYPGTGPNGIQFSTGEPMEFMRVRLTNLTVVSVLNGTNGTLNLLDQFNNNISTMDASKWFTLRGHRDPASTYVVPPTNTRIDTIWGYVLTNSGGEAPRGYRIAPLYPGDIKYGVALARFDSIRPHRRDPIVVPPDSTPVVSVRVTRGGSGIAGVQLRYSVNNAPFVTAAMTFSASDTTYKSPIPQQLNNTNVRYYISVVDSLGNVVKLASSATDGSQTDTLRGFFFYNVINRPLTIRDIQYTPFLNGRSGYIGARVTLNGIMTADTASLGLPPTPFRGTNVWYLQSTSNPWSGIWVHNDSLTTQLLSLRNGDSVSITGTVAERIMDSQTSYVTRLGFLAPPVVYSSSNPSPSPVVLPTSTFFNVGKGTPSAEQWEGMLVQFNNVTLTDTMPVFQLPEEFAVNDGSGAIIIRKDGKHRFTQLASEVSQGRTLIRLGARISYLRGLVHFSGNQYKIVPRTSADFGTITNSVELEHTPGFPKEYMLGQNYPNPFNPTTTIEFNLPKSEYATVKVYNMLGQEIESLVNGVQDAGKYTVRFDAARYTSGVYFYRMQAGQFSQTKKMVLVK